MRSRHGLMIKSVNFALNFCAENEFENVHQSRTLKETQGAVWERCDFELAHSPYAWLPLYIFIIFILFVGKSMQLVTLCSW